MVNDAFEMIRRRATDTKDDNDNVNKSKRPVFPESVADGTIATWHKQPGEPVKRDELIVDIETDKVVLEVVAPADGVIEEVLKERRRHRGKR